MLCAIVLLSLATLALGLSPSALEISVKAAASTVASVDDIVIGVVVYNPTDKDIRVIARNNILDTSSTRSFTVKALDDELVFFMGVRALYDLSASDVYMTIPAGGYVAVNHTNVGALYLFEFYGTGTYTFEPIALFQGGPDTLLEVVDVPPFKVEITHDVKRRNPYPRYAGCSDASKNQVLLESFNSFRAIAQEVYSEFQSSPPEQMLTYFSGGGTITEYLSIDSILDYMAYYDYAILPWVIYFIS
ncbi:hypothetical protein C0993_006987 [Termitomyces sp. T159_Od127]|nr:hypothetical protein C0993_006987 [Termitomyces sp. T159_Od127]